MMTRKFTFQNNGAYFRSSIIKSTIVPKSSFLTYRAYQLLQLVQEPVSHSNMDAIASILVWPLAATLDVVCTLIAIIFVFIPSMLVGLTTHGTKITKATNMFTALRSVPGGRYMFSKLVGFMAPYTGSIGAIVSRLTPGSCEVSMTDRPWKRNPFGSLHACAIANLAELTSGLAGVTAMESTKGVRGIPVKMTVSYISKARGTLTCVATLPLTELPTGVDETKTVDVVCDVKDASDTVVASAIVKWSFRTRAHKKKV